MYQLKSPTSIILPRKTKLNRKVSLNLNQYRNLHYQVNNQVKQAYNISMYNQLKDIKLRGKIDLHYYLLRKGKRIVDNSNIYCIVDKFFCDALVHWGCIEDDSDDYIHIKSYDPTMYNSGVDCCNIIIIGG